MDMTDWRHGIQNLASDHAMSVLDITSSATALQRAEDANESAKRLPCMNTKRTSSQVAQRCSVRLLPESLSKHSGGSAWPIMLNMSSGNKASATIALFTSHELMRVAKKKRFCEHGLHSRCRHDQRSVQYSLAFQHARATRSSLFRKWKRAHSESALFQY